MGEALKLLTSSSTATYRACPRLYQLRYVRGYRPTGERAHALHFGTAWHLAMESWWGATERPYCAGREMLEAMADLDPFDRAKLVELLRGYHIRWEDERVTAVTIEQEFRAPLVNPDTGAASRTFERAGKKDAIAVLPNGERWLVEHKTTSEDISPGATYWQRLRMNAQVSNYYVGARANGHDIVGCIYDVVAKPKLKPFKATPEDKRKYKKDGSLYANQRDRDETPEEFADRLRIHIADNPDAYFQRVPVHRLESDEREAARDLWHTARAIRDAERLNSWPRNDAACFRWNRQCDYWDVCTGQAQLDDPERFERVRPHEELSNSNNNQQPETNNGSSRRDSSASPYGTGLDF